MSSADKTPSEDEAGAASAPPESADDDAVEMATVTKSDMKTESSQQALIESNDDDDVKRRPSAVDLAASGPSESPNQKTIMDDSEEILSEDGGRSTLRDQMGDTMHFALIKAKKFTRCECVMFVFFLIIFTAMSALGRGESDFNFTQTAAIRTKVVTSDQFRPGVGVGEKTYLQMSSVGDIWNYINDVILPVLLVERYPNNGSMIDDERLRYYPIGHGRLLGGIRLRQVRLNRVDCDRINDDKFTECWGDWTHEDFSLTNDFMSPFEYEDANELDDQPWRGKFNTYPGGGYVVDLPLDYENASMIVSNLMDGQFIDGGTILFVIDFNIFNPTQQLTTVARLAMEMPTGGVFPNYEIKTWKFNRYLGESGALLIFLNAVFLLFVLGFTIIMAYEMKREGCYCSLKRGWIARTGWRWLDLLNMAIFYAYIIFFVINLNLIQLQDLYDTRHYRSFRRIQFLYLTETYLQAINAFLSFLKLFKFFSVNKRMRFFFTMMRRASQDILMFALVLCVFFLAFGVFGFLVFSSDMDDYRSPVFAFFNMMRFVVSDMDFTQVVRSSRTWGSAYYVLWSILMILVLANVFIAILSEAYAEVQMELKDEDKIPLGGFFGLGKAAMVKAANRAKNALSRMTLKKNLDEIDADGDGQIDAKELAQEMKWTVEQAQEFIDEHDTDKNGYLDVKEWEELKAQMSPRTRESGVLSKEELTLAAASMDKGSAEFAQLSPRGEEYDHFGDAYGGVVAAGNGRAFVSQSQFAHLERRLDDLNVLLRTTLEQTKLGARALKQLEVRRRTVKRRESKRKMTVEAPLLPKTITQPSLNLSKYQSKEPASAEERRP